MNKKNYKTKFVLEEMRHHDKEAKSYSRRVEKDYIWEVPTELFLIRNVNFLPGMTVIDFGCGPSTLIKHTLSSRILKTINYIGVDISGEMLKIAKKNIPSGKFIKGNMEDKKFKPNFADIIISLGALHHSQNQYKTLDNWINILKKDGVILLREPTLEALKKGFGESPNEEGVNVELLLNYLKNKKTRVEKTYFFTTPAFHLLNKISIALCLGKWKGIKKLWYPVIIIDSLIAKLFGRRVTFFKGYAFAMIITKL